MWARLRAGESATTCAALRLPSRASGSRPSSSRRTASRASPRSIAGRNSRSSAQFFVDILEAVPVADGKAGEIRGAERGGFRHHRAPDRDVQQIGLELQQHRVGRRAAIDLQGRSAAGPTPPASPRARRASGRPSRRPRRGRRGPSWCCASARRSRRGRADPSTARRGRRTPARDTRRRCPGTSRHQVLDIRRGLDRLRVRRAATAPPRRRRTPTLRGVGGLAADLPRRPSSAGPSPTAPAWSPVLSSMKQPVP